MLKAAFIVLLLSRCSTSKDTTGNIYQNTVAHYNGYFYAREKIQEIEKTLWENVNENYHQIPKLYPEPDTTLVATYKETADEAIKMAYISIKRHPHSRWLYPNYIMVGLARAYLHNFKNAIQTFKYVNTKSHKTAVQHTALLHLIHTLVLNEEYKNAEEVIYYLEKEKLTKKNNQQLQLEKAYYYQMIKDYKSMAKSLLAVTNSLTKKEDKGRVSLITAQVCHKLGLYAEAHNYYKRCIKLNPIYKIDLYARLGLLETTPIKNDKTKARIGRRFKRLLTDKKNVEFKNKIYYEIARFERDQGLLKEALANYKSATKAAGSELVKTDALLSLGQIYFDSLEAYIVAEGYYSSGLPLLSKDTEHYDSIKHRQKALKELVKYMNIITWQDSLLNMAKVDSATLRARLRSFIKNRSARKKEKEKEEIEAYITDNSPSSGTSNTTSGWYFESPMLVSLGTASFKRIWGNIPLEDNWRRSNKIATTSKKVGNTNPTTPDPSTAITLQTTSVPEDEAGDIMKQLPKTPAARKAALKKIEDAYFMTGSIFLHKLSKTKDAIAAYTTILNRFPTSQRIPEALYQLYLISSSQKPQKENTYYQRLVSDYPNSTFTKIVVNPTYLTKQQIIIKTQKEIYQAAYGDFEKGDIRTAQKKVSRALGLGTTPFSPKLELLDILIIGKTATIDIYKRKIKTFLKKYPENPLNDYANKLLITVEKLNETTVSDRIRYAKAINAPHCFAFTYLDTDTIPLALSHALKKIIGQYPKTSRPEISRVVLNKNYMINFVCEFTNADNASAFFNRLNAEVDLSKAFSEHPFHRFIITKRNLTILRKTKALEEYMAFFDRNYNMTINPPKK